MEVVWIQKDPLEMMAQMKNLGKLDEVNCAKLKYSGNEQTVENWKCFEEMISLNPLLFENKEYIGSWKHFVLVFVCGVCLSLCICLFVSLCLSEYMYGLCGL